MYAISVSVAAMCKIIRGFIVKNLKKLQFYSDPHIDEA
jgi:hypothetical protein